MDDVFAQVDKALPALGNLINKLIKDNEVHGMMLTDSTVQDEYVPWKKFEAEAKKRLSISNDLGWKLEFERQCEFNEGVLKKWNHKKGMVPIGMFMMCSLLKPATSEKKSRVKWSAEENDYLVELHNKGMRGKALRLALQDRFGDRRDYMNDGPVFGQMRRLGLRD